MFNKKQSFAINSYSQATNTIAECHKRKIFPILYIKYFLVEGLGLDWIKEFKNLLEKEFSNQYFAIYIDCKNNYGLFISLVEQKIDYIKIAVNKNNIKRLNQIAKKNKVLINPKFSVVDLSKIKNINKIIKKI